LRYAANSAGGVVGEDFAAGVGDGFVGSRPGLSEQDLELGEDALDGVEVGGVFPQGTRGGLAANVGEGEGL
jgi:hypothetical protein